MGPVTKAGCGGDGVVPAASVFGYRAGAAMGGGARRQPVWACWTRWRPMHRHQIVPDYASLLRFSGAHHLLTPRKKIEGG